MNNNIKAVVVIILELFVNMTTSSKSFLPRFEPIQLWTVSL